MTRRFFCHARSFQQTNRKNQASLPEISTGARRDGWFTFSRTAWLRACFRYRNVLHIRVPHPLLHRAQIDTSPQRPSRKRCFKFVKPEVRGVQLGPLGTRLQAVQKIERWFASGSREEIDICIIIGTIGAQYAGPLHGLEQQLRVARTNQLNARQFGFQNAPVPLGVPLPVGPS